MSGFRDGLIFSDNFLQDQRISCVHTQTIEMHQSGSGAVTALIYHKGLLFSGYSDGSVKVCVIFFNKNINV